MITKNGAILMSRIKFMQIAADGLVKTDGTEVSNFSVSGTQYFYRQCSQLNLQNTVSVASQGGMVMNLGVGSAEPAASDYWLDETDIDGVDVNTVVTCQHTGTWNPTLLENGNISYTFTFLNTGLDPITISEIGLSFLCETGKFLVGRKVIPPRTVESFESVTFTYELELAG